MPVTVIPAAQLAAYLREILTLLDCDTVASVETARQSLHDLIAEVSE